MTTDTDTTDDRDASLRDHLSRRHVLQLLGLVAATGRASASDGDVAVGGGGAGHDFRHGGWSFAPPNFPPDDRPVGWVRRDALGAAGLRYEGSLPQTWTANGIAWALAADRATAKAQLSQYPAVALGADGTGSVLWEGSLPQTWSGGGVSHAIGSDLPAARTAHDGSRPAVLWGADGTAEVRV